MLRSATSQQAGMGFNRRERLRAAGLQTPPSPAAWGQAQKRALPAPAPQKDLQICVGIHRAGPASIPLRAEIQQNIRRLPHHRRAKTTTSLRWPVESPATLRVWSWLD